MEFSIWIFKWRHLVGKFRTNAGSVIWPKLEPMECLTWIFLSTEFACFVAGEINQVIEAMPGSVVPLAMFWDVLVFLNVRFAIFLRIWFVFHSNLHFLICYKSVQNLVIVWRFLSHCLGMPFWQAHGTFTLQFQIWSWDVITYIFGHQMTPLARVAKLATWWHHSH